MKKKLMKNYEQIEENEDLKAKFKRRSEYKKKK